MDIELTNKLTMSKGYAKYDTNCAKPHNRPKIVMIVNFRSLMKSPCNKTYFIALNAPIRVSFDAKCLIATN